MVGGGGYWGCGGYWGYWGYVGICGDIGDIVQMALATHPLPGRSPLKSDMWGDIGDMWGDIGDVGGYWGHWGYWTPPPCRVVCNLEGRGDVAKRFTVRWLPGRSPFKSDMWGNVGDMWGDIWGMWGDIDDIGDIGGCGGILGILGILDSPTLHSSLQPGGERGHCKEICCWMAPWEALLHRFAVKCPPGRYL